ncbi:MinD/ParA family protein [Desulforhabdus amnigena]|jgi:flagellar biosynthesis protein FlhG|uniref:Site-determining protein n=1 Tax=Desulforhabdus amnigena TaxID=40218 RepID=A0A9W6CW03_9BACT|nr:MinD/ParA family protein [Desulforhabdus amnigena]NLJ26590.1 MinD/ParA family protein [Deltaproteobacteria bacterium]GLI33569.1 site-determining protein [Desulforhabdus amnigena]
MDQALGLRSKREREARWKSSFSHPLSPGHQSIRVMTVSSGKGGVGKSNIVVNLALAFDQLGKRVLIMDADLGLANIDLLLGLTPKFNVSHVLAGNRKFSEVLVRGPGNIRIMPASSGVQQLTQLSDEQKLLFLELLEDLETEIDILLIDTGAGISDTVLYFNLAAQERIVVVTPEPTSLTDAYALIKVLFTRHGERYFKVLANSVEDEKAGKVIFGNISKVADHFLDGLSLDYLGSIPHDPNIQKAVLHQRPLLDLFPNSPASKAFHMVANRIEKIPPRINQGTIQFFWKRLLNV